jgi:hypothetical protein
VQAGGVQLFDYFTGEPTSDFTPLYKETMCPSEPVGPGTGGDTPPSPPGQNAPPHPAGPPGYAPPSANAELPIKTKADCVLSAVGEGLFSWETVVGFGLGARKGFQRGVQVVASKAFVRAAVVAGTVGAIGTFEAGGSGGPVAYLLTRAGENLAVVGGYTIAYGVGGAVGGAATAIVSNARQCFTGVQNAQ